MIISAVKVHPASKSLGMQGHQAQEQEVKG